MSFNRDIKIDPNRVSTSGGRRGAADQYTQCRMAATAESLDAGSWTHGSSEQRVRWFTTGMDSGSVQQRSTFEAPGRSL